MAGAVSNLMVRAGFDGSQLTRGLQQMQGQVQGAQSSLRSTLGTVGKVTAAAVATAGAALVAMGGYIAKTGIAYDAMQESSQVAWTTLLGSTQKAKQMIQDIATFAAKTQFDTEGVDAMAKYLNNAGYSGQKLFDQLTRIADVSGAFNITADNAKELVRQMSQVDQAQVAYTSDLDILQNQGIPIFKAIAAELHTNVAGVRQMASQGKITSDVYDKAFNSIANTVKGSADKQSATWNGMMSTLKDDFSILSGILAKPLFNALHDGLTSTLNTLNAFVSLGRGDLKGFQDTLESTFGKTTGDKITAFVLEAGKVFLNLKNDLFNAGQSAKDFFNKAKDSLGGPLTNIFNSLKDIGGTAFNDLAKFASNAIAQIRDFWQKDGDKIMAAIKQAIQDVSAALDASKPFLKAVFDIITTVGIKAFNSLMDAVDFLGGKMNWILPILAGVTAAIGAFKIISTITTLINAWREASLLAVAVQKAMTIAQWALNIAMDANPIGLVALAIGALVTAGILLYQNWDTVKNKMQVIWMEIKADAQDAVNGVIDKINQLIGVLNKIPGVSIPIVPKVNFDVLSSVRAAPGTAPKGIGRPGGAMAAYASGTSYHPGGLAIVGEQGPELLDLPRGSKVYTNSQTNQMLNGSSQKTYNVTVNALKADMNENDLVRALRRMEVLNNV